MRLPLVRDARMRIHFPTGRTSTNVSAGTAVDLSADEVFYYPTRKAGILLVNTSKVVRARGRICMPSENW
jgi:hypothetical protein